VRLAPRQLWFAACGVWGLGCGLQACGGTSTSNHHRGAEASAPAAQPPSAEQPPRIVARIPSPAPTESRFAIDIQRPETLETGRDALVSVSLKAIAPWHVNLDYPTSLELAAPPQVRLAREVFEKRHAAHLDEDGFKYEVGLSASAAGEKDFRGVLVFAVCEEEACIPVKQDIRFVIAVQ